MTTETDRHGTTRYTEGRWSIDVLANGRRLDVEMVPGLGSCYLPWFMPGIPRDVRSRLESAISGGRVVTRSDSIQEGK
jgi:hypothetical protein